MGTFRKDRNKSYKGAYMRRKAFIEAQGATCKNWTWSWSFINEKDKIIIFGAWDQQTNEDNTAVILKEEWEYDSKHRKKAGYSQSREHIRLIEEEGYRLKTFIMFYSDKKSDINNNGPAAIKGFIPELHTKELIKKGKVWYAVARDNDTFIPEEVSDPMQYHEGACNTISVNAYERNPAARKKCIEYYGCKCFVCSYDFEKEYGSIGKGYIHVHHLIPLSKIGEDYCCDPIKDLRPVCPNCHAIIHRKQPVLSIDELKTYIMEKKK